MNMKTKIIKCCLLPLLLALYALNKNCFLLLSLFHCYKSMMFYSDKNSIVLVLYTSALVLITNKRCRP